MNASEWGKRWAWGMTLRALLNLHGTLGATLERVDYTARLQKCIEVLATAFCINIHQGEIGLDFENLRWSLVSGQRTRENVRRS